MSSPSNKPGQALRIGNNQASLISHDRGDVCGREDHTAGICFSLVLMVLAFASIRFGHREESIVKTAVVYFVLVRGSVQLVENDEEYSRYQNKYIQNSIPFKELSLISVDTVVTEIITMIDNSNNS